MQALRSRRTLTEAMTGISGPTLYGENQLAWDAFWDCRRGRATDKGIAWRDVQYWCDTYKLDSDIAIGVHDCIVVLDTVWLRHFKGKT